MTENERNDEKITSSRTCESTGPRTSNVSHGGVRALLFRLDVAEFYPDAPEVRFDVPHASFHLDSETLICRLTQPVATIRLARALIDPILRAWEFEDSLHFGFSEARFAYAEADADGHVAPEPAESLQHQTRQSGGLVIALRHFSEPPQLQYLPDLIVAWERWRRAIVFQSEPLQSIGYYILTLVEREARGRKEAAGRLAVDHRILRRIGELTTVTGDARTARKAQMGARRLLSRDDERWLSAAIRHVLFRAAHPNPSRLGLLALDGVT